MTSNGQTRFAASLLRFALAAAYLSAVADRFGFWGQPGTGSVSWGNFHNFLAYTASLIWYAPETVVAILAWTATILGIVIAVGLLSGQFLSAFAYSSSVLLVLFALAMTSAKGAEPALTFSVWTAATASLLLASLPTSTQGYGLAVNRDRSTENQETEP